MTGVDAVLSSWYEGEIGGEALFKRLAGLAEPAEGRKWRILAELESSVASHLAHVLSAGSVALTAPEDTARRAVERHSAIAALPWVEKMQWLRDIAGEALRELQSDAKCLPPPLAATSAMVLRHESALLEFAELELAGQGDLSLQPIIAAIAELRAHIDG